MPDIFSFLRWQDIVDILVVTFIIHRLILLIRGTRAVQMLIGIIVITVIYFISRELDIFTLNWLLRTFLSSIFLIIVIVFQHDIRRALTQVGKTPFQKLRDTAAHDLSEIIRAAIYMAKRRMGALIIIERETGLRDYVESGHYLDAQLSRELLICIFLPSSPMHDGGVIISKGRVHSAACVLPLSNNPYVDKRFGTRHRAALGLSEETDAVILVVSEETQEFSVVQYGKILTFSDEVGLRKNLESLFLAREDPAHSLYQRLLRKIT